MPGEKFDFPFFKGKFEELAIKSVGMSNFIGIFF